jgi:hypothetical protein
MSWVIICWCQKAVTSLEATFFLVVKAGGEDALKAKKKGQESSLKKNFKDWSSFNITYWSYN